MPSTARSRPRRAKQQATSSGKKTNRKAARKTAPREARTASRDLVVIGASGGGLEALTVVLSSLPANFPAAVAVVLHRGDRGPNVLRDILARSARLPVVEATDGMDIQTGRVYLPPLDHHLFVEGEAFRLSRGPKENHVRPAVDVLFRTAALSHGPRLMAVILTGSLDDGTSGLLAVKRRGGLAIVQDPDEALFDGMPRSAVEHVAIDYKVPLVEVPAVLIGLAGSTVELPHEPPPAPSTEGGPFLSPGGGPVTAITCPACGGALRETQEGEVLRFSCHTGHRYGATSLVAGKDEDVEGALWAALRALNEKAELTRRLAQRARTRGDMGVATRYLERLDEIEAQIRVLRGVIQGE